MEPSSFFLILVSAIPSRGATRIPSVRTANPTLVALSRACSMLSAGHLATSLAVRRQATSRLPASLVLALMTSATPLTL